MDDLSLLVARLEERLAATNKRIDTGVDHAFRFFQQNLEERDKRVLDRLNAEEEHRNQSIAALAQRMTDAMSASDKAVRKAEEAQREYNIRSNEFRSAMDDQQKTLLSRSEYATAHIALEDKFVSIQKTYDGQIVRLTENFESKILGLQIAFEEKLKAVQMGFEKTTDRNLADIVALRESRSEVHGRHLGNSELIAVLVGIALVLATLFLAFGPVILHR